MRDLNELTSVEDPAWPLLAEMVAGAQVDVSVLPGAPAECESTLLQLQVTTRSWLGAVAMSTGGFLVDHGWLRIYGGSRAPSGFPGLAFPARLESATGTLPAGTGQGSPPRPR